MTSALLCPRCDILYDNFMYWFQELKDYIGEVKQANFQQDPSRIYNCDETGFLLAPKMKKVIALKCDKHVYQGGTTSNKNQSTILLAASAIAHYVKLLVVYPGVQLRCELHGDYHCRFPEGLFRNNPSGWMDTELFHSWLENGFNKSLIEQCVRKSILPLIDGVKCHILIQAREFRKENNIIL